MLYGDSVGIFDVPREFTGLEHFLEIESKGVLRAEAIQEAEAYSRLEGGRIVEDTREIIYYLEGQIELEPIFGLKGRIVSGYEIIEVTAEEENEGTWIKLKLRKAGLPRQ